MRLLPALVAGLVLALAAVAWLVLRSGGDGTDPSIATLETNAHEPDHERPSEPLSDSSGAHHPDALADGTSEPRTSLGVVATPPPDDEPKIDTSLAASAFEAVVVDERTRLPLSRYLVRLHDVAGRRVDAVTDDKGKLNVPELAVGDVRAYPMDHERRRARPKEVLLQHILAQDKAAVITIESGPLYRISITPERAADAPDKAPDPAQIDLKLTVVGENERTGTALEPLRIEAPYRLDGEPFWVRFPAMAPRFDRAEQIQARTRDGLWMGDARVSVMEGEAPGIVTIDMDARAVVHGKVLCDGAPVSDAIVTLRMEGRGNNRGGERTSRTGADGKYRFEFQRAGEARLRAKSMRHSPGDAKVALRSGEAVERDILLAPLPIAGPIRGVVMSDTGAYELPVHFTLTQNGVNGRESPQMRVKVAWEKHDGALQGRFDFGEFPAGSYRMQLEEQDWFEWSPRSIVIEPPRGDIVARVKDAIVAADLVFSVHDQDNGKSLGGYHLQLETYEGNRAMWSWSDEVVLPGYPEDKRLRWRLDMPGYPPKLGDLSAFNVRTVADGRPRRTCEINMSPGWGDQLRIVKRNSNQPLANVVVELDGQVAGKSGGGGVVYVTARDKPSKVELKLDGWRMVGEVDLQSPSKRGWNRFNTVQMQPAPKKK